MLGVIAAIVIFVLSIIAFAELRRYRDHGVRGWIVLFINLFFDDTVTTGDSANVPAQLLIFVVLMLTAAGIVAVLLWRAGFALPGP